MLSPWAAPSLHSAPPSAVSSSVGGSTRESIEDAPAESSGADRHGSASHLGNGRGGEAATPPVGAATARAASAALGMGGAIGGAAAKGGTGCRVGAGGAAGAGSAAMRGAAAATWTPCWAAKSRVARGPKEIGGAWWRRRSCSVSSVARRNSSSIRDGCVGCHSKAAAEPSTSYDLSHTASAPPPTALPVPMCQSVRVGCASHIEQRMSRCVGHQPSCARPEPTLARPARAAADGARAGAAGAAARNEKIGVLSRRLRRSQTFTSP